MTLASMYSTCLSRVVSFWFRAASLCGVHKSVCVQYLVIAEDTHLHEFTKYIRLHIKIEGGRGRGRGRERE